MNNFQNKLPTLANCWNVLHATCKMYFVFSNNRFDSFKFGLMLFFFEKCICFIFAMHRSMQKCVESLHACSMYAEHALACEGARY